MQKKTASAYDRPIKMIDFVDGRLAPRKPTYAELVRLTNRARHGNELSSAEIVQLTVACANKDLEIARLEEQIARLVDRDVERYDDYVELLEKHAKVHREAANANRWIHEHKPAGWTGIPPKKD